MCRQLLVICEGIISDIIFKRLLFEICFSNEIP
jgi:hypothetical protein